MSLPTTSPAKPRAKTEPVLAILQVDATGLQLLRVQAEGDGLRVLSQVASPRGGNDEDGTLEAQLRAFVQQHLREGDVLSTVLPRYEITTRLLELPSQDDAEIAGMLQLNAEEHVPYAAEELVIKHVRLYSAVAGESAVLAVFARNNVIDDHMALLDGAGLHPEQIFLSTACLIAGVKAAPRPTEERFALVHLATGGMEVVVFDGGRPVYVRGVSMQQGWHRTEEGALATEELTTEVRASLSAYRRESLDGMGVEQIFLSADWPLSAALCDEIAMETGKECAPADFLRAVVPVAEALPAALIGGALSAAGRVERTVNLLPERVRQARQLTGMRNQAVRIVALVGVVLLLCLALYVQRVWQYRAYISELEQQVRALEPQSEGVAEKQRQLNIISRQVNREGSVLDLLGATVAALPEQGINITKVDYERATGLDIWGRAMTVDDVSAFTTNLHAAGEGALSLLRTAHTLYNNAQEMENGQPIMQYQISMPVEEKDGEEEEALE